jgi:hypothetical protein
MAALGRSGNTFASLRIKGRIHQTRLAVRTGFYFAEAARPFSEQTDQSREGSDVLTFRHSGQTI